MISVLPWAWLAIPVLLFLAQISYNAFFHPLRNFPGPAMAGATSLWRMYKEVVKKETLAQELFGLHEKYGKTMQMRECVL